MIKSLPPNWLLPQPIPREEVRILSGRAVYGWAGRIDVNDIRYYEQNRRTEASLANLRRKQKQPNLDDYMMYKALVDDPELDIENLARDILLNGLRTPLILSYNKELLDGNRRYLAHRWIAENGTADQRQNFSKVPVWVLSEEDSDEYGCIRVITQYNFLTDFHQPWTDIVKAKLLYEQHYDAGYSIDELYAMYGGAGFTRHKIREFIKTYELIANYIDYCPNEDDALLTADEHFIWFQQLQRSYSDLMRSDDEFEAVIFNNIRDNAITTTNDLKNLKALRSIPEAWSQFKKGQVKDAHLTRMLRERDEAAKTAPDTKLTQINVLLGGLLVQEGMIERVSQEVRDHFHELAEKVPGRIGDVNTRIAAIMRQLNNITSSEFASMAPKTREQLQTALQRVVNQANATPTT